MSPLTGVAFAFLFRVLTPGSTMTDPIFQQAYEVVRMTFPGDAWNALSPRQITQAIYQEIRRIDAARARAGTPPPATRAGVD